MRTALSLIVIPRSRSRSIVSSTCSRISRLSSVPVSSIRRSARVDLPWSIWATMQKLRMWSWRMGREYRGARYQVSCQGLSPLTPDTRHLTPIFHASPMASITGWFDPVPKGGPLRLAVHGYLPAPGDLAVRLPGLRRGDRVTLADGRVTAVNGVPPTALAERAEFPKLGAVHPSRALALETPRASSPRTADIQRVVDLICPLGFGQRALIVSPPKAGKTIVLQAVAESVALNYPAAELLLLLVDERPEEVSEMVDWGRGEVIASSFDLPQERHVAVAEM